MYGSWSMWGECSVTCGFGVKQRVRANLKSNGMEEDEEDGVKQEQICGKGFCPGNS